MRALVVLVADDSATVRALARLELEDAGYVVHEAVDGAEAVRVAIAEAPDVVLLDVEMPVLDGYGALAALKADHRTADVPVVFLTSRADSADIARALDEGAHDHLRKPPEPAELLARVAAAARVKALQDDLRARLEELDRISRTDDLTGLYNRRHTEEHLAGLCSVARRHRTPLAVLLVDVDRFKSVNDTHGHAGGDLVLRRVALCLAGHVRTEDLVGRWGGEEFLVLLPHSGVVAAEVLGDRLRAAVAALDLSLGGEPLSVTISLGGAADEGAAGVAADDLLLLADRALYRAKSEGRDRVVVVAAGAAS